MEIGYIKGSQLLHEDNKIFSIVLTHIPFGTSSEWSIIVHPKNNYSDMYFILLENLRQGKSQEMYSNIAQMIYDRCARINMQKPEYVECEVLNWVLNENEKKFLVQLLSKPNIWNSIIGSWDWELDTHHDPFPRPDYMQLP